MTDLVVCTGIEGLPRLKRLAAAESWQSIFVLSAEPLQIKSSKNVAAHSLGPGLNPEEMTQDIASFLQGRMEPLDVALSFCGGNGTLHMAALAALLKLGAGIRLVAVTEEGVKEL